jgi:hypothetical protein
VILPLVSLAVIGLAPRTGLRVFAAGGMIVVDLFAAYVAFGVFDPKLSQGVSHLLTLGFGVRFAARYLGWWGPALERAYARRSGAPGGTHPRPAWLE